MSTTTQNPPATKANQAPAAPPARFQEETINKVLDKINAFQENGQLRLPAHYIPGNALQSAYLMLQDTVDKDKRPVLEVCTKASIANALLDMVLKGLNPVKKQCYFIAYGNELCCDESYFGKQVFAKRVGDVKDIRGFAVYQDDIFVFERKGKVTTVLEHKQDLSTMDPDKVIGSYAIIEYNDGRIDTVIMNMKQIRASWNMGQTKGQSPAHKGFPDEMAIKTVVGRACKQITNSTDDADLFTDDDMDNRPDPKTAGVTQQIAQEGNKKQISMSSPAPQKPIPVTARETQSEQPEPEPKAVQPDPSPEDQPPY